MTARVPDLAGDECGLRLRSRREIFRDRATDPMANCASMSCQTWPRRCAWVVVTNGALPHRAARRILQDVVTRHNVTTEGWGSANAIEFVAPTISGPTGRTAAVIAAGSSASPFCCCTPHFAGYAAGQQDKGTDGDAATNGTSEFQRNHATSG